MGFLAAKSFALLPLHLCLLFQCSVKILVKVHSEVTLIVMWATEVHPQSFLL